MILVYIVMGFTFGMILYWVLQYYVTAKYEKHLIDDLDLDAGETRIEWVPSMGCKDCGFKNITVEYVNPILRTGNYYSCLRCGWVESCEETDDGKDWGMKY